MEQAQIHTAKMILNEKIQRYEKLREDLKDISEHIAELEDQRETLYNQIEQLAGEINNLRDELAL